MPSVEELLKKSTNKKFVKKDRRPWDYDIAVSLDSNDELSKTDEIEKNEQKQEDKKVTHKVTNKVTHDSKPVEQQSIRDHNEETLSIASNDILDYGLDIGSAVLIRREIQNLVGVQKKIFFTVFNTCVKEGALSTITFSSKNFEEITKASSGTVKMSLKRIFKKNLLLRLDGKRAKGGYLYIGFDKEVWDICMQLVNRDKTLVEF